MGTLLSALNLRVAWAALAATVVGGVLGVLDAVMVNDALLEISVSPFFATSYGTILCSLGSLMLYRKLWQRHERMVARTLVLASSVLVLCAGISCFFLERDWFKTDSVTYVLKVPMYMMLGVALSFTISCSLVDIVNSLIDRCRSEAYALPLVWSPQQVFIILAGAVLVGATVGLLFGWLDIEDHTRRVQQEGWTLVVICSWWGGLTGLANVLLSQTAGTGNEVNERSQLHSAT